MVLQLPRCRRRKEAGLLLTIAGDWVGSFMPDDMGRNTTSSNHETQLSQIDEQGGRPAEISCNQNIIAECCAGTWLLKPKFAAGYVLAKDNQNNLV